MYSLCRHLLVALFCLAYFPVPASAADFLTGSGCSVSVPGYLADLARAYEKETGVAVLVLGGGSVRGLVDLKMGRMDFAASCKPKSSDDPEDFEYITACWDALVFIVNKTNPVDSITPDQVRGIYEGKISNWKEIGGPDLAITSFVSVANPGGVMNTLSRMLLHGKKVTLQRNSSQQASSAAIWEQRVEETAGGFATTGFGSARKRNVNMLKVNGIAPTKENIVSGKYPFKRPLYIVIKRHARPEVRKFVDFVLSRKGQRLISSYGMPSLTDMK